MTGVYILAEIDGIQVFEIEKEILTLQAQVSAPVVSICETGFSHCRLCCFIVLAMDIGIEDSEKKKKKEQKVVF